VSQRPPLVISHAACAGHAPENTLVGLRKALELGADAIEVDVQATADGVPVLMHDLTVVRTTDGTGPVATLTLVQIKALDAGAKACQGAFRGEPVPTLAEAMAVTRGRALLIAEIKAPGMEAAVAKAILEAEALEWASVCSFFPQSLEAVRAVEPRLPCALILPGEAMALWPWWRNVCRRLSLQGVSVQHNALTARTVRSVQRAGLALYAWTVDDEDAIRRVLAMGVGGVVSNYPERVLAALGR
jgi:glycerophosphoryl diester phosphodiesterase